MMLFFPLKMNDYLLLFKIQHSAIKANRGFFKKKKAGNCGFFFFKKKATVDTGRNPFQHKKRHTQIATRATWTRRIGKPRHVVSISQWLAREENPESNTKIFYIQRAV
jgi:hypothetical protein